MQLGECTAVPQNTHPPACPSRYLVLAFKIFLAPIRAQHMASRLQPDKPRGYRFHARTAHHSHRRRHPLLQPRQHQLLQHHPHALPCPKKSLWHAPPVRPRCAPTSPALPALPFLKMLVTGVTEVSHLVSLVPQSWRSRDRLYRHSHSLLDLRPFPALSAHGLSRRPPRGEIITTRGILLGTPARFRPVFVVQHRDLTAHGHHL